MKVITESTLRTAFKHGVPDQYFVDAEVLITPSARQYLRDKNVALIVGQETKEGDHAQKDEQSGERAYKETEATDTKISPRYVSYYSGGVFEKKPEHMTQIYGHQLVYKDNPRIILRGKLDTFQSGVLGFQIAADRKGEKKLTEDLEDVLKYARDILRAEVLNEALKPKEVIGLSADRLRAMSHDPKHHFGVGHLLPHYEMGEIIIGLNALRAQVREVEIAAVTAFRKEDHMERLDIITALNRLSSCIYIMMCKYAAGLYC